MHNEAHLHEATHSPASTQSSTQTSVQEYRSGQLDRRAFLARLITVTGSMAAAHLMLEKTGLAQTVLSQTESQRLNIVSSEVEFRGHDGANLTGAQSTPVGDARHPGIVVIHENRGLNEHIRGVARRFAESGFVALAPDALARVGGTGSMASPDAAREAIGKLSPETAMDDLKAALAYLNTHSRVLPGRVASIGFCWGGARSFLLATESDLLRAALVFYGSAPSPEKLAQVRCPVFGFYGETDERITSQVPAVAQTMAQAEKQFQYKIYPGAGHAFFNDTGGRYDAAAAADAWKLALRYLDAHLR